MIPRLWSGGRELAANQDVEQHVAGHRQPVGNLLKGPEGGLVAPVTSNRRIMIVGQHHLPMVCQDDPASQSLTIGSEDQQALV